MPIKVGRRGDWQLIRPTRDWQSMKTSLKNHEFEVATDLYYVNVAREAR